jgi:hypothetical protein
VRPLLAMFAVVTLAAPARADRAAAAEAEAEMVKAKQAMERREFEAAVGHLLVARSLAPEASGPYLNLGLAYAALGRCDDAIPVLEEYLRRKTRDPQPSAAATLAACRASTQPPTAPSPAPRAADRDDEDDEPRVVLGALAPRALAPPPSPQYVPPPVRAPPPRPGHLTIKVGPLAAEVAVNGQRVAADTRQAELDVPAGAYNLRVTHDGYHPYAHEAWVAAGETRVESVALKKKRAWPAIVGVLVGAAVTSAIIAVIVTQTAGSSAPDTTSSGHTEVGFPTKATP